MVIGMLSASASSRERPPMSKRSSSDLRCQALRLPQRVRDRLEALANALHAAGTDATAASITRGLCVCALDLAHGAVGHEVAAAFRVAAGDSTQEGVQSALEALLTLLDVEPPTKRMRSRIEGAQSPPGKRPDPPKPPHRTLHSQALRLPP